jgi:hypothetical protein
VIHRLLPLQVESESGQSDIANRYEGGGPFSPHKNQDQGCGAEQDDRHDRQNADRDRDFFNRR